MNWVNIPHEELKNMGYFQLESINRVKFIPRGCDVDIQYRCTMNLTKHDSNKDFDIDKDSITELHNVRYRYVYPGVCNFTHFGHYCLIVFEVNGCEKHLPLEYLMAWKKSDVQRDFKHEITEKV
jgi:hypothetical protein